MKGRAHGKGRSKRRAGRQARDSASAAEILDSMSAHVAVIGRDGRIRQVNRAWSQFARANTPGNEAPPSTCVGVDYVAVCRAARGEKSDEASLAADGIEAVLGGRRSSFVLEYPCDSKTESRWFAMHVTPLSSGDAGAVVAHYDITTRKLAELALAVAARRTDLALNAAHMGVWTIDLSSERIEWSEEVRRIVGVSDFDGTLESWTRLVHPEDVAQMQSRCEDAVARRMPFVGDFRIVRPGGEIRWLSNVAQIECDASGVPLTMVGTVQDITARRRSEWALTAYNDILELIAAGAALRRVLDEVVRLVEEQLPGSLCSILIVDPEHGRLRIGSGRSLPDEYNRAVDGVPIGPKSGSCGTAAYRRATVTVTDIATDPLWEDYRALALRHGLRSCVSVPIFSSGNVPGCARGEVIGTFAVYNRTSGAFDRLTYAVLAGAEDLVRRAFRGASDESTVALDTASVVEATHLAGVAIERDRVGQALRESEERFRAVVDSAPAAIYVTQLDGRHGFVNRAMASMFGVPAASWAGKRSRDILPGELAALFEECDRRVLEAGDTVEGRHTCRLPDGREATVLTTHVLLRRASGEPYAVCGMLLDISELIAARRGLERLWLHAPDPLCVVRFDGYFAQVNPAWTRLLGWTEEELCAVPHADFVHPDDRAGLADVSERLVRGENVRGYENRYRCRDGSYRSLSWNAIPVPEHQLAYGITRDVTEEKRLAEQFHHAQKIEAIGQLASGIAHDFNNLLTVITGHAELLLGEMEASDPRRESLADVLAASERASELTSQLLAFSRKAIIEPKILDVNQVVESSTRMLRRLIGENVQLEKRFGAVPPVKIDPGQLGQIFVNLAVNARDAMPQGGRLTIATELVPARATSWGGDGDGDGDGGERVQVRVVDTGTGMTPEVKARVFEPFFTTKGPGVGTGLGLATVYGIVRQAGGTVEVESAPGAGTAFTILLPVAREAAGASDADAVAPAPRGSETILLAEDEDGVRHVARSILVNQGYHVLTAKSGADALRMAGRHDGPIDLLLTDVIMPDFGGRALARALRDHRPDVRVLFMSGYTDDEVIRAGVESAREMLIQKPFTRAALARRVRAALDEPAARPG